jgi:hypothetical protein
VVRAAPQAARDNPSLRARPIIDRSAQGASPTSVRDRTCVAPEARGPERAEARTSGLWTGRPWPGSLLGSEFGGPHRSEATGGPPQGSGVELTGRPGGKERHACGRAHSGWREELPDGSGTPPLSDGTPVVVSMLVGTNLMPEKEEADCPSSSGFPATRSANWAARFTKAAFFARRQAASKHEEVCE